MGVRRARWRAVQGLRSVDSQRCERPWDLFFPFLSGAVGLIFRETSVDSGVAVPERPGFVREREEMWRQAIKRISMAAPAV